MSASRVSGFLRQRKESILRAWEERVTSEEREVALTGRALRDHIPSLLKDLATWLESDEPPENSLWAARAFDHVMLRLDAGLSLGQLFREYRLLRETTFEAVLDAESTEQQRAGAGGDVARVKELARLNAGLDVVLSQSIEQFVAERDRRAAAERARAAQVIQETETRYRSLFESIDEGFCIIELLFEGDRPTDCRFLRVNPAFERHTGLKDITGKRVREVLPEIDLQWFELFGRVAQIGTPARFQGEVRALGRFYDVYAFPAGAPEEHQLALLFTDITERKRAEEALRINDEQVRFRLELSDALRRLTTTEQIHATVSRLTLDFFRADRCYYGEMEGGVVTIRQDASRGGLPSAAGVYPLDRLPLHQAALETGRPLVVGDTTELQDEGLQRQCLEWQISSFLGVPLHKEGKLSGLLYLAQSAPRQWSESEVRLAVEVAERAWTAIDSASAEMALREVNCRLVAADQKKNEFLAVLSHELRNPLVPIRNSVYILEHALPGGAQALRARQVIERQVQHLGRLIDDLLDVTRIARGKIVLQRERVDLFAIARAVVEDHRGTFARDGVALELRGGEPVWVDGDPMRLAQVIGNLVTNSGKFTPRGGKTVLCVTKSGGRAVLRVSDDGAGMSPEAQRHLFEPFVQAPQTLERTRGGLGLGLALVKGMVELHGGTIAGHSEGPGRGSEFVVTLPLEASAPAALEVDVDQTPAPQGRRVLVVEDNVDSANSLSELLALGGNEVAVAYSGPAGLEAARAQHPDVIFCDIGLPELDGYEIARALRHDADPELRQTYLVALSGYALPEDVRKAKEAGFDRHLAKPPSLEALRRSLELAASGPR